MCHSIYISTCLSSSGWADVRINPCKHELSVPFLILSEPGSVKTVKYKGSVQFLTSHSPGLNLHSQVFAMCVIERYGFRNFPRMLQQQQSTYKERESRPEWEPATPCTLHGPGPESDRNPDWHHDFRPQLGKTSTALRKGGGMVALQLDFWRYFVKMNSKCNILTLCVK